MKNLKTKLIAVFIIVILFYNSGIFYIIPSFAFSLSSENKAELEKAFEESFSEELGYDVDVSMQYDAEINMPNYDNIEWENYIGKSIKEINEVTKNWTINIKNESGMFKDDNNTLDSDNVFVLPEKIEEGNKSYIVIAMVDCEYEISIKYPPAKITKLICACGGFTINTEKEVTKVEISGDNSLEVGDTLKLKATVSPSDATDPTITWSSNKTSVATVDKNGKVTGKSAGEATITATASNGKKDTHKITVKEKNIDVTSVTISGKDSVAVGESIPLEIKIEPKDATDPTITWSSSDKEIATVDKEGNVTGKKVGEVTITAKSNNGKTATHKVKVKEKGIDVEKITIAGEKAVQVKKTITLTAEIEPDAAKNQKITWSSSDETIATVNADGIVKGVKVSDKKVTITAKAENGVQGTFDIMVKETIPVEKIKIIGDKNQIKENEELSLKINFTPSNVTKKDVTWFSNDEEIVKIDETGKVTAKKSGEAIIIAITDNMKIATYKINVLEENEEEDIAVESIEITGDKNRINIDEELQLNAIIMPEGATNKEVKWISGNEEIAVVAEDGKVTGKNEGKTTIMAFTNNMKIASYEIIVGEEDIEEIKAESIEITGDKNRINIDEELQLNATIMPEGATNNEVKWISGDEKIAIVDENGIVTGKEEGETKIIAFTNNLKIDTYNITVEKETAEIEAESVEIIANKKKIMEGEKLQLEVKIMPEDTTNKEVTWSSSDETIASIDKEGIVTGKKAGKVTITATTNNLKRAECEIEVKEVVEEKDPEVEIIGKISEAELKVGEKSTMNLNINAKALNSNIGAIMLKIEYPINNMDITISEESGMKILSKQEIEEQLGEKVEDGTIAIIPSQSIKENETKKIMSLEIEALKETNNAKIKISNISLKCINGEKIELDDIETKLTIEKNIGEDKQDSNEKNDEDKNNTNNNSNNEQANNTSNDSSNVSTNNSQINNSSNKNNKDESLYNGNLAYAGKNIVTVVGLIFISISSFILYRKYKII